MLKIFKVKVEPLTPATFEPFGRVFQSFDEVKPEVRVGGLTENEYTVTADTSDLLPRSYLSRKDDCEPISPVTTMRASPSIRAGTAPPCFSWRR